MDDNIFNKGDNIARIIQGLPISSTSILDFKSSSDASKEKGFVEDTNGGRVHIREGVGRGEG